MRAHYWSELLLVWAFLDSVRKQQQFVTQNGFLVDRANKWQSAWLTRLLSLHLYYFCRIFYWAFCYKHGHAARDSWVMTPRQLCWVMFLIQSRSCIASHSLLCLHHMYWIPSLKILPVWRPFPLRLLLALSFYLTTVCRKWERMLSIEQKNWKCSFITCIRIMRSWGKSNCWSYMKMFVFVQHFGN